MTKDEATTNKHKLQLKRIYEAATPDDGCRVLIDRLWPRGISKEKANIHLWLKEAAPSPELRKSFCHIPERFPNFKEQYVRELQTDPLHKEQLEIIQQKLNESTVTLLYAAKDEKYNHAIVLYDYLMK